MYIVFNCSTIDWYISHLQIIPGVVSFVLQMNNKHSHIAFVNRDIGLIIFDGVLCTPERLSVTVVVVLVTFNL